MPDAPAGSTSSLADQRTTLLTSGDPKNVTSVMFGPGVPLTPSSQQPLRGWDFPVNVNTNMRPRAYEGITFASLRSFANVELVRMAIETRKDQIESQNWTIKPKDSKAKADQRAKDIIKFLQKPDGVTPLATFFRILMEDLLVIDAPCMELRRTRGGKLIGLEYVPGDTIVPKVDATGRVPTDDTSLAYQQVIKGVVWNDLTRKDILYVPRNLRSGHVYGYSPVEQIIVTIQTIIRRQAAQLAHFTAGNIPSGLLNAPEGWQLDKIKELQDWLDDKISGNQAEQAKIVWGPAGSKYQAFKDAPLKDDFDEWLARMVAYAFSIPPTPFIRQMNRSTGETDQERSVQEGLEPLKLWFKRWIDHLIETEFGADDLEFMFIEDITIDPVVQSQIDDRNLRNGSATIDEVRDARGQDPLPDGLGKEPLVYGGGVVKLSEALADEPELEAPQPVHLGPDGAPVPGAVQQPDGAGKPGEPSGAYQGQSGGGDKPEPPKPGGKAPAPKAKPEDAEPAAKLHTHDADCSHTLSKAKKRKAMPKGTITVHRPKAVKAQKRMALAIHKVFGKAAKDVAAQVQAKLDEVGKAAGDDDNEALASRIALKLDLAMLAEVKAAIQAGLIDISTDSGYLALDSVGGFIADEQIVDKVFDRAVAWAKQRAADLVSLHGEDSLVASTRDMIRQTIVDGLEGNIGKDGIAQAIMDATAFSEDRSELIARTEISFANENGKVAGWNEVKDDGYTIMVSWLTTNDDNCCDDCTANEDEGEIELGEAFPSGDTEAPAHPRCQCATTARAIANDDQGEGDDNNSLDSEE